MPRYPKEIIDTAIGLLDVGMAYRTVQRILVEKFPEDTKTLDSTIIATWNKKYRAGKPPMMWHMHFDPMLFIDAIDMIEQGNTTRRISAIIGCFIATCTDDFMFTQL